MCTYPLYFSKKFLSNQNCVLKHCREDDVYGPIQLSGEKKKTTPIYGPFQDYTPQNNVLEQVREDDFRRYFQCLRKDKDIAHLESIPERIEIAIEDVL